MIFTVTKRSRLTQMVMNPLALGSAVFFAGGILAGVLGYGLQIVLGLLLGVEDYGLVSSLIALYVIATSPLNAMMLAITKEASHILANQKRAQLRGLLAFLFGKPMVCWGVICAVMVLATPVLTHLLKGANITHILCLAVLICTAYIWSVISALINAMHFFKLSSVLGIVVVMMKIVAVWLLIFVGFRVNGVLLGFAASSLVVAAIGAVVIMRETKASGRAPYGGGIFCMKRLFPIFISYVSITTISQYDLLLVKYLYTAQEAGEFALAAVLGKAIFYLPISIGGAVFPIAARSHALEQDGKKTLFTACTYVFILAAIGSVILWLVGDLFIGFFYGEDKLLSQAVIRIYGFAMIPLAIIYIIEHYYIANGKVLVPMFLFGATIVQIIALTLAHVDIITLVYIETLINLAFLVLIIAYVYRATRGTFKFNSKSF